MKCPLPPNPPPLPSVSLLLQKRVEDLEGKTLKGLEVEACLFQSLTVTLEFALVNLRDLHPKKELQKGGKGGGLRTGKPAGPLRHEGGNSLHGVAY